MSPHESYLRNGGQVFINELHEWIKKAKPENARDEAVLETVRLILGDVHSYYGHRKHIEQLRVEREELHTRKKRPSKKEEKALRKQIRHAAEYNHKAQKVRDDIWENVAQKHCKPYKKEMLGLRKALNIGRNASLFITKDSRHQMVVDMTKQWKAKLELDLSPTGDFLLELAAGLTVKSGYVSNDDYKPIISNGKEIVSLLFTKPEGIIYSRKKAELTIPSLVGLVLDKKLDIA
jgi:hypothetical protein